LYIEVKPGAEGSDEELQAAMKLSRVGAGSPQATSNSSSSSSTGEHSNKPQEQVGEEEDFGFPPWSDEDEQVAKAIARSLRSKRGFVEVAHIMHSGFGDKLWKVFVTNRWSIVVDFNGSVFGWKITRCAFHVWITFGEFGIQGTMCRIFANRLWYMYGSHIAISDWGMVRVWFAFGLWMLHVWFKCMMLYCLCMLAFVQHSVKCFFVHRGGARGRGL